MQNRMFYTTNILINGHPVVDGAAVQGLFSLGATKTGEIPSRINKSIECVCFSAPGLAACGTIHLSPGFMPVQGIAGPVESNVIRQNNGQVGFSNRHHAAIVAMNYGYGAPPIPLPRDTPISKPVHNFSCSEAACLGPTGDFGLGRIDFHAVKEMRVREYAWANISLCFHRKLQWINAVRYHYRQYDKAIFAGEIQVTLVMSGAAKNGTGAIFDQHEISYVNG